MANRQYIGARYVPKFFEGPNGNEWQSGVAYEPLTVVSYLNNSYTSKKPVPVRTITPNLDTEYWVLTGNYNGQYGSIIERLDGLDQDVANINTELDDVEEAFANRNAKKVVILGDSYAVDASAGGTSWATILANALGSGNYYRSTIGGTGFGSDVYISENNLSMLQGLDIQDKNAITDIVILGGANDANLLNNGSLDRTSLSSKIRDFMNYCKTYFINATVKVSFIGWHRQISGTAYNNCADIYQNICNEYANARYFANGEVIMHNDAFLNTSDNIHPIQDASNILGKFAMSVVNDSVFSFRLHYRNDNISMNQGFTLNGHMYADVIYNDDTVEFSAIGDISGGFIDFRATTPPTVSGGVASYSQIFKIPNFVRGINRNHGYVVLPGLCGIATGAKKCKLLIIYNDNVMGIRIFNIEDVVDGTEILNILVPPFTISMPTRFN